MKKTGICILNYNGLADTKECLYSLRDIPSSDFLVFVVDNASEKDELSILCDEFGNDDRFEFYQNDTNAGFAEGNNIAIRELLKRDDVGYIMLLNNDTVVTPHFLSEMKNCFFDDDRQMVGIRAYDYYHRDEIDNNGIRLFSSFLAGNADENDLVYMPSGCCVMYHRSFFEEIEYQNEYLDADFFCYGEDVDLGLRGRLLGYETVMVDAAHIYHKGSATAGKSSDFSVFHGHRNNVLYAVKSIPLSVWLVFGWVFMIGQLASFVLYIFNGRVRVFLKAKISALKMLPRMIPKRMHFMKMRKTSFREFVRNMDWRLFIFGG